MAWYRTGTVAVTDGDTVITGTGTQFATHARVGDGFVGPDGRMYEVTNIASETVLAIFPPYQGATAAGQEYGIIPVQGYPKQLADRAGAMVDRVGELPTRIDDIDDVLAELGTAARKNMPAGITEFGTVVERDVVESPDDTTPYRAPISGWMGLGLPRVSEGQGFNSTPKGTGLTYVKNPTAGLSAEGYLLEMLSDDPEKFKQFFARQGDGAFLHRQKTASGFSAWFELFDTGNCVTIANSFGVAWRFPDGKQICAVEQYFDLPGDSNWKAAGTGSYRELGAMATYPAPFVSAPDMFAISSVDGATNRGGYCTYVGSRLTTHIGPGTIVRSPEPAGYGGGFVFYLGLIGRWK